MEWDLDNLASYGGLGPSEANGLTGEIIGANVLVQGPTIIKLYTDWHKVTGQARALAAKGDAQSADQMLADFSRNADAEARTVSEMKIRLGSNKSIVMNIYAIRPELAAPYAERNDFDELPPNVDFKTYMYGYFHDMLTHELGHNLGLRHNFRGNMGASDSGAKGSVSRSVMEYMGRSYRFLDDIGPYDIKALKYGYTGAKPDHTDWFCTDEDKWTKAGA